MVMHKNPLTPALLFPLLMKRGYFVVDEFAKTVTKNLVICGV
jgi:hypothetical protein